jgi:hypothetical protein
MRTSFTDRLQTVGPTVRHNLPLASRSPKRTEQHLVAARLRVDGEDNGGDEVVNPTGRQYRARARSPIQLGRIKRVGAVIVSS